MNPVCPYCRAEIGCEPGERRECPGCGTPHHADCFAENGGCTVFGCSHAPTDEAKITVGSSDFAPALATVPAELQPPLGTGMLPPSYAAAVARAVAPQPPPPPADSDGVSPPPPPPPALLNSDPAGYGPAMLYSPPTPAQLYGALPKNRVTFVLLGVFLGMFGVHNFYTGYVRKGVAQLCITLLTCFYGSVISWIWAIVEICTVEKDNEGVQFN